jgi:hypothetical protein
MKKFIINPRSLLLCTITVMFIATNVLAQSPNALTYQVVVRNASNQLMVNQQVGMQISILQESEDGSVVYSETQSLSSNDNGLISTEIGAGEVISGDFSSIDWTDGPYFIKTETDTDGNSNYTITSISQLLSVPFAFHANTAERVTIPVEETDPVFSAWDKSTGISITESQISDLDHFTNDDETDPEFNSSVAANISASDTSYWNNKLDSYTETDPEFSAWDKSTGISISESQITDLDHFTTDDETDPIFNSSVAAKISASDTTYWNNKLNSYTETDPEFSAWDKSTGISISESQITDLDHFTNDDETDPLFANSEANNIVNSGSGYVRIANVPN